MPADVRLQEETLQRLLDAGRALVAHLDVERVLDDLLHIAAEVTGARYCAIGVMDEDRRELERFLTFGVDPDTHRAIGDLPRGRGILGVLIDRPQPLRLANVGADPRSYGFPSHHPPMKTFLGVPLLIRGEAWGNLYLTEKAGGREFTAADEQAVVVLSEWAAIAIENARLYARAEDRRQELERAVQGLEATTAIARAVGSETDLDRVLELIVKRGRALVDARSVVLLLSVDESHLVVAATAGQVQSGARGTRINRAGTAVGDVVASGRAERIADVGARLALDEDQLGIVGAETGLIVPLAYRGGRLGALAAFDRLRDDPGFGDEEQALLESFAASAATAVATAKSVERDRLRDSLESAERERRRWARELHDETLQALAALRLLLSSGLRSGSPEALEAAARQAVEQLQTEVTNLRTLITELRPAALDDLGLAPAIDSLARRVDARESLTVAMDVRLGDERLPGDLETAIYRMVQEALSNVVKHARARTVEVGVLRGADAVDVHVADDGRGMPADVASEGFGLVGMRERAALHGADIEIASSSAGTTVRARFPLDAQERVLGVVAAR